MKHAGESVKVSESCCHVEDLGWLDDLDAWEGYEFWSAQIEAEMESQQIEADKQDQSNQETGTGKGRGDGLPF